MAPGRSALIIATSTYSDPRLATLAGPAKDAAALKGVLGSEDIGGFEVKTLMNARSASIRETLEAFFSDRARDDLLLVSVSCHGLKDDDGQLFLAASDTKLDRLMSTGIDAGWVNRLMDRCRSDRIALFLDCCFAGAFSSGMTRRAAGETAGVKDQFKGRGLVVITASDAMQYSFEGGRQVGEPPRPSPFTQALVDGLRTGEADRNEDGQISINELFDYLEDRVREASPSQTPTKSAVNQTGDWVIARSTRVPSVKLLPERVQLLLKSGEAIDRLEAIIDLERIRSSPDERTAQAATAAIQTLTTDDSRRVAQRAMQALSEHEPQSVAATPTVAATVSTAARSTLQRGTVDSGIVSTEQGSVDGRAGVNPFASAMARAAARGLLGSLIGAALGLLIADLIFRRDFGGSETTLLFIWISGTSLLVAVLIELLRLRLPARIVPRWAPQASNRWAESAMVGFIASIVAVVVAAMRVTSAVLNIDAVLSLMAGLAIGFVAAEAVVGKVRPHPAPGSAAR